MGSLTAPPREVFADVTRRITEAHDTWDSLHKFITLHWDGEQLAFGTVVMIDPAFHPTQYADLMSEAARDAMDGDRAATLWGYALQIEGHSVVAPDRNADIAEQTQFNWDRLNRRFHTRPDAVESAMTHTADIHGRLWGAIKHRDTGGIEEVFYRPGERASHGQMVDALLSVAAVTGTTVHGLPMTNPFGGRS